MNSRTLTGALALALVVAAGVLLSQRLEMRRLAAEIADLRIQLGKMASLEDNNRQLAEQLKTAIEASRVNQSELMRLRGQGSRQRQLEQENAQLQAQRQELNRRLSAAQEAAPPSLQSGEASQATTLSEANETDSGLTKSDEDELMSFVSQNTSNAVIGFTFPTNGYVEIGTSVETFLFHHGTNGWVLKAKGGIP